MKKIYSTIILATSLVASLASCSSDDDITRTPLSAPTISSDATQTAANRLAFNWSKVEGATEYYYLLKDSDGKVLDGGITSTTSYSTISLSPESKYTLSVTAMSSLEGTTYEMCSDTVSIDGKTNAVAFTSNEKDGLLSMEWSNIIDVDSVLYSIKNNSTSTVLSKGSLTNENYINYQIKSLGDYSIILNSYYSKGTKISLDNVIARFPLTSVQGKAYLTGLDKTIDATLKLNNDGTYTITSWYGGTKDFTFSIGTGNTIVPINAEGEYKGKYFYNTGRTEDEEDVYQAIIDPSKSFAYSKNLISKSSTVEVRGGKISLSVSLVNADDDDIDTTGGGYYTFSW